jgi:Tn3 transposase DDE domain
MTALFGSGTLSSSDGQRFPTKGKSITARALSRYFADEGLRRRSFSCKKS